MSAHAHFARSLRHDALDRLSDRRLYRELGYVDGQWTAGDSADSFEVTDPATGTTWSGRGLQPKWLKAALASGRKLSDFAV